MAIKKSEIYSSLWASCNELRGGMDASSCLISDLAATMSNGRLLSAHDTKLFCTNFSHGQCRIIESRTLQDSSVRKEVCQVMEGVHEAFSRRWDRLGRGV